MRLTDREFSGTIIKGDDPKNCGRYRVLIQELMYNIYDKEEGFIYCNNQVANHRSTHSETGIYGQYFPLHPGTKVIVKFNAEDYETGYIDRIISDYYEDSMPLGVPTKDRDEYYQLMRTIENDLICITHNTTSESLPSNSMLFYHKGDNVKVAFDKDGVHVYTKQKLDIRIDKDSLTKVDGNNDEMYGKDVQIIIGGDRKVSISGDDNLTISGDCNISIIGNSNVTINGDNKISITGNNVMTIGGDNKFNIHGNCKINTDGNCDIKATGLCNIDSIACNVKSTTMINLDGTAGVNINCGLAPSLPASTAKPSEAISAVQLLGTALDMQIAEEQMELLSKTADSMNTSIDAVITALG